MMKDEFFNHEGHEGLRDAEERRRTLIYFWG